MIDPLIRDSETALNIYSEYANAGIPEEDLGALFHRCTIAMFKELRRRLAAANDRLSDVEATVSLLVEQARRQDEWSYLLSTLAKTHIELGKALDHQAREVLYDRKRERRRSGADSSGH